MNKRQAETMVHPLNEVLCDVHRLQPGDVVEESDLYRSMTLPEEKSGLGQWFMAGPTLKGTVIGPTCNVSFIRLQPIVGAEPVMKKSQGKASKRTIQHHGR